ncbi:SDR family NAD(P)-dependent oxidoreductase [Actinomycetospora chiangmaiensis]|uniref:SDR family NAD(P)-dependent oxidoreductase n=1 Tax=Actinomycetospora chiangmaiensis TaxID=402650 RepID=UPI00036DC65F|nr:SDR family oxidoreductase [Actinomycetospora chiangmaiensis]
MPNEHLRVLLTGGTSGLGLAMARALVDDGHHVVLTGRDTDRAAAVSARLDGPGTAHGLGVDVRDADAVAAGTGRAVALLGGLDVVVLNAGIGMRTVNPDFLTDPQPFWEVDPDAFRAVVDTNLTGYFLTARAALPALRDGGGRLVVVSMNHSTMVRRGFVPYGPSRAGAEALARIMAADLEGGPVTVNILLPGGATRTGMVPDEARIEGLLDPEVMVRPLRWLCSEAAAGVHDERLVATEFDAWLAAHGFRDR